MELPRAVYDAAEKYFGHHGCWHLLRKPTYGQDERDKCFPPGDLFPKGLRNWREPGSGEDFLRFHRMMIRNLKWILGELPAGTYAYRPWKEFPGWLIPLLDAMDPFYREKLQKQLEEMVIKASLDDLGRFIEGAEYDGGLPQVHWVVHDLTSSYEGLMLSSRQKANMSDMATACLNEHFWGFHGWIDSIYASWQDNHSEKVDQSPHEPPKHPMCDYCRQLKAEVSLRPQWEEYLKLRSSGTNTAR